MAEADEFDRSFLRLTPVIAVITNIDRDHLDTYGDLEAIQDAFVEFAQPRPLLRPADRLPGRRQRAEDPAARGRPPHHHLRPLAAGRPLGGQPRAARRRQPLRRAPAQRPLARPHRPRHHRAADPRPAQRAERPGGGGGRPLAAHRLRHHHPRPRRLRGGAPPLRAARHTGAAPRWWTTTPTTRRRSTATLAGGAPDASPTGGCSPSSSRTSSRAPRIRPRSSAAPCWGPTWRWSPTSTPRASSRSPASPASWWSRRRGSSGHRNVHYCPSWQDAPALLRDEVGPGDVVMTLGAGDVNRLAQALVEEGR